MFHKISQPKFKCTSILVDLSAHDYISLVAEIHSKQGGIVGQRAVLKTKTARTIRSRMVGDISRGASLPPLVLGILLDSDAYQKGLPAVDDRESFLRLLKNIDSGSISIIDGMQRTMALIEAMENASSDEICDVRVEFWIADQTNSLIYRMLVLNTGQVPWDLPRQLEAIYRPLLEKVGQQANEEVKFLFKDQPRRHTLGPDEYATEDVAELILIFSARKRELNVKDQVAEDFVRLDLIESTARIDFISYFSQSLVLFTKFLSAILSRRIEWGKDPDFERRSELLQGFPAKAGFFSALAVHLFDKPGFDTDWNSVEGKFERIRTNLNVLIDVIQSANSPDEKEEIVLLEELEERITKHKVGASQVGRFQREFYETAYSALFADIERISNLRVLWHAY